MSASPANPSITPVQLNQVLQTCLDLQNSGVALHSKRPFAALLLGPDNTTVLLTHLSISHVQHAETELARLASIHYSQDFLWACTLVSTWEPCAMCSGTLYWANIGRLVYAASEEELRKLTGEGNDENMTMALPCRKVLESGQKKIEVTGPVKEWEEKVIEESGKWWEGQRAH
jgi:tRNA(Arg) A34 adenosine deaminase TadA